MIGGSKLYSLPESSARAFFFGEHVLYAAIYPYISRARCVWLYYLFCLVSLSGETMLVGLIVLVGIVVVNATNSLRN